MKRASLVRFLVGVAVAGSLLGCGSGDGDDGPYDFGGRWVLTWNVTTSTIADFPTGTQARDALLIAQDGSSVTVTFGSTGDDLILEGTCDVEDGTFTASGLSTGDAAGRRGDISGRGIDANSMSGAMSISNGDASASGTWTADLASRGLSVSPLPGAGGGLRALLGGLAR